MLPSLTAPAASRLPPSRLATGIAVQTTARLIGSALGIAILVPVPSSSAAANFEGAWKLMIVAAVAAGLTIAAIGRGGRPLASAPAPAPAPAEAAA